YTLQLKEPRQFDWMDKRKETLNLVIDHTKKEVIISVNNECGKSNMSEFFNDKSSSSIGKFPWHSIRKWEITGYDDLKNTWQPFFRKKPLLLYRSLLDPNSSGLWRTAVSFWRTYTLASKREKKKIRRKLRSCKKNCVMRLLKKSSEDGIQIGKNHGFIDYSPIVSLSDLHYNTLSNSDYRCQSQFLIQMLCEIKRDYAHRQNLEALRCDNFSDSIHKTDSNSALFCITINDIDKALATNVDSIQCPYFKFQHSNWEKELKKLFSDMAELRKWIARGYIATAKAENSFEHIQHLYDNILYLRDLVDNPIYQFNDDNKQEIDENEEETGTGFNKKTGFVIDESKESLLLMDFNYEHNEDNTDTKIYWLIMSNAMIYIVFGRFIDFSTGKKETTHLINNELREGWDMYDILKNDDANKKKELISFLKQISLLFLKLSVLPKHKIKQKKKKLK
ncbi:hypothetical protein RFI_18028, partial [Reticulomyxa filosa]